MKETAYISLATAETSEEFDPAAMGVACVAVLFDGTVYYFEEDELGRLYDLLERVERLVGVNDFVVRALEEQGLDTTTYDFDFIGIQSVVSDTAGVRVSFNNITTSTFGEERTDPIQIPLEWQSGNEETVKRALKKDVTLLSQLDEKLRGDGYVWITDPQTMEERKVSIFG
ncbi:MAG: hypothetical protein SXQ77_06400 [Halobacteria archaeon]|nr:hypothetical protein [Halobacteria archaeon]